MLTAQDMTYDEARNLHSKWLKHQAFMAELQSNKEWLDKIEKVLNEHEIFTSRVKTVYNLYLCVVGRTGAHGRETRD